MNRTWLIEYIKVISVCNTLSYGCHVLFICFFFCFFCSYTLCLPSWESDTGRMTLWSPSGQVFQTWTKSCAETLSGTQSHGCHVLKRNVVKKRPHYLELLNNKWIQIVCGYQDTADTMYFVHEEQCHRAGFLHRQFFSQVAKLEGRLLGRQSIGKPPLRRTYTPSLLPPYPSLQGFSQWYFKVSCSNRLSLQCKGVVYECAITLGGKLAIVGGHSSFLCNVRSKLTPFWAWLNCIKCTVTV